MLLCKKRPYFQGAGVFSAIVRGKPHASGFKVVILPASGHEPAGNMEQFACGLS